jgi:hypothetical protein
MESPSWLAFGRLDGEQLLDLLLGPARPRFQAGFSLGDHLLYRLGLFDGERDSNARNSRTDGYLQYDFFATEAGYAFLGTALGKKRILAVNSGFDEQGAYRSWSANIASDTPVRPW